MFVRRCRPHRLAGFSFSNTHPARFSSTATAYSEGQGTASTSQPADGTRDSIFTAPESPWDHVFTDVEPPISTQQRPPRSIASTSTDSPAISRRKNQYGTSKDPNQAKPFLRRRSAVRGRASLTAREMSVFDEMFDLIFNAVSAKEGKATADSSSAAARTPHALPGQAPGIGRPGEPLGDLFRTLRRHTSRVRWTTAIDEELDRKKETMELFNTDHELLRWVTLELFGEAQRWDEEAKKAIAASSKSTSEKSGGSTKTETLDASGTSTRGSPSERPINHSLYPHLIAHAMRIFRMTYSNPTLSLAVFNHAARVSIPSYVFGCTAPAYNELIEAKWEGWGDLEGVCSALEEMRANGVKFDGRTRIVVETVRREVGEARPGKADAEEKVNPLAGRVWRVLGEAEVMKLLHRIEQLALRDRPRKPTSSAHAESWKSAALEVGEDDGWRFDGWERGSRKHLIGR